MIVFAWEWELSPRAQGRPPRRVLLEGLGGGPPPESTAHSYTSQVIDLLAECAPGLLKVLREADADFVLLDGTLAECDRVGMDGPTTPTSTAGMEWTCR